MHWTGPLDHEQLSCLSATRGSYALFLQLPEAICLAVGRLGTFNFHAGVYVYLGSANGPGGLRARLAHHARIAAHPHWHLDYFRPYARITGGLVEEGTWPGALPLECAWSQQLLRLPGVRPAAPGFGSADCRSGCPAHLLWQPNDLQIPDMLQLYSNHYLNKR